MGKTSARPERRALPLDQVSIEELLGQIVINWNNFEGLCRILLCHLCGAPPGIKSLTNELNGSSLYFALKSAAAEAAHPEVRKIVECLAEGLNRLNEHRNYYVHGASSIDGVTGQGCLLLSASYAKGEVRIYENRVEKREMYEIACDCAGLGMEAFNLTSYLMLKERGQAPALPDMPFLPPKLEKTRHR